jgi:microcystin-dependent protein
MDPFIGEIRIFPFAFAPKDWALCAGQLIPIQQNAALFSILGTTYGGNGTTTFALPDLTGKTPIGTGQGQGLTAYGGGETGGQSVVTLLSSEMPNHAHGVLALDAPGDTDHPAQAAALAASSIRSPAYASTASGLMGATSITGGSQAHNNMPPYLAVGFYIALYGIFPSRS